MTLLTLDARLSLQGVFSFVSSSLQQLGNQHHTTKRYSPLCMTTRTRTTLSITAMKITSTPLTMPAICPPVK